MDKGLIGLFVSLLFFILAIRAIVVVDPRSRAQSWGLLILAFSLPAYIVVEFFDTPILLRESILEGEGGATFLAGCVLVGMVLIFAPMFLSRKK